MRLVNEAPIESVWPELITESAYGYTCECFVFKYWLRS